MAPSVSVIVPVYNTRKYLDECLASAVGQSLQDIEILVVDDGSTDGSAEVIDRYAEADARITVIRQENRGRGRSRNTAIRRAAGKYMAFLDSDDYFDREALAAMYGTAGENDADIVICGIRSIGAEGRTLGARKGGAAGPVSGPLLPQALRCNFETGAWDKMYRGDLVRENGILFDEEIEFGEDLIFYLKAFCFAKKAYRVGEPLYNYRNLGTSAAGDFDRQLDYKDRFIRTAGDFLRERGLYREHEKDFAVFYFRNVVMSSFWQLESVLEGEGQADNYSKMMNKIDHRLLFRHDEDLLASKFAKPFRRYLEMTGRKYVLYRFWRRLLPRNW